MRLNAVTLGVADLARSVRFYEDLSFPRRHKATGDAIAFFDASALNLKFARSEPQTRLRTSGSKGH